MASKPAIEFDNSYANSMQGFYAQSQSAQVPDPKFIKFNTSLAEELGLDDTLLGSSVGLQIFSGNTAPVGSQPLAQVYAGHQFGGFSQQLGDGRALLLGEVIDVNSNRRDIQLKGSGRTPFSRGGDGKSALGPVLREYVVSETMHNLGVPTTRALAAVTTGEDVMRETSLPGAVLTRVAASHLRVGTFQFFAARGEAENVRKLADYAIARHYPEAKNGPNIYLAFLEGVIEAQAKLIAKWMLVGFVHGVMNTDNMTISGETIDYGPCAFIDAYDPNALFSSIDQNGRYAYKNQPLIGQWNLARLAETLVPLISDDPDKSVAVATQALQAFDTIYNSYWLIGMRAKLGLTCNKASDMLLATNLLKTMEGQNVDYTGLFRNLAKAVTGDDESVLELFENKILITKWLANWHSTCSHQTMSKTDLNKSSQAMNAANPLYIPRNHLVEEAITAAVENNNFSKFESLVQVLDNPFTENSTFNGYKKPAPVEFGKYITFCGT